MIKHPPRAEPYSASERKCILPIGYFQNFPQDSTTDLTVRGYPSCYNYRVCLTPKTSRAGMDCGNRAVPARRQIMSWEVTLSPWAWSLAGNSPREIGKSAWTGVWIAATVPYDLSSILEPPHAGNAPGSGGDSEGAEVSRTCLGLDQYRLLSSMNSHRDCPFPWIWLPPATRRGSLLPPMASARSIAKEVVRPPGTSALRRYR